MMTMKVRGGKQVLRNLEKYARKYPEATAEAVHEEALLLEAESIKEAPVDTGRMRASSFTKPPQDKNNPVATVGYGTKYAIYVHEREELNHTTGKAKFLIDPFRRLMRDYGNRLARRIKRRVR